MFLVFSCWNEGSGRKGKSVTYLGLCSPNRLQRDLSLYIMKGEAVSLMNAMPNCRAWYNTSREVLIPARHVLLTTRSIAPSAVPLFTTKTALKYQQHKIEFIEMDNILVCA